MVGAEKAVHLVEESFVITYPERMIDAFQLDVAHVREMLCQVPVPHIYAVGDCAGYWQLAHTAFREGEVAAQNACGHDAAVGNRAVPRPIYTDPEIASVGLTEAQAREQHGDDVEIGKFPWIANACSSDRYG